MSLIAIMDEMAATLRATLSTVGFPIQVETRYIMQPSPPTIDVYPGDPFREETAAGFGDISGQVIFTVRARVSGDQDAEQDLLIELMDEEEDLSVATALMDDQTLNGYATSVYVQGPSGYRQYVDGDSALLGCEWRVTILRAYS